MRSRKLTGISVVLALVFPVLLLAQDVNRDWDKSFDFSKIKTFSIKIGTGWNDQISQDRVLNVFATTISGKGWMRTQNEADANAMVVLHGATEMKHTLNTFYDGWGGWGYAGMGMGGSTTTVSDYKVGTLVVDIFDNPSKKLIFRGTASDELNNDPQKNTKKIDKAAEKMFKDFPQMKKDGK